MSDILIDLGLGDRIVGRDAFEEQLPDGVPRVGDLMTIDYEAVIALNPSDVVLQSGRAGVAPQLLELATARNWNVINDRMDGLADIQRVTRGLAAGLTFRDEATLGEITRRRAEELCAAMDAALAPLPAEVAERLGPILLLHLADPPSAFGPGSYLVDVLSRLGAPNALASGSAWQELDLEAVLTLNPWAVVLVQPVADSAAPVDVAAEFGPIARLALDAARGGRLAVLRHPQSHFPSTSIVEVAGELRTILEAMASADAPATERNGG